jgi:predicted O-methyltransferase YrrM
LRVQILDRHPGVGLRRLSKRVGRHRPAATTFRLFELGLLSSPPGRFATFDTVIDFTAHSNMPMSSALPDARVRSVLDALHSESEIVDPPLLAEADGKDLADRTALLDRAYIPVSPDAGRLLYALVRGVAPGTVVEFGTSFGISTIYLAAAVRDRGTGSVITTEIHTGKAAKARGHIEQAGLLDAVDLRVGDALATLQNLKPEVSLVFLDGWKDLYLPVLKLIEPALRPGALVIADDLDLFPDALQTYLDYVRDPVNGYVSVKIPIGDAMELSTRAE